MTSRSIATVLALALLTGCSTTLPEEGYLLGDANAANIRLQSVRDVDVPNSALVDNSSGTRAAEAVRALNEGRRQELRVAESDAGEGL